jgi:hypothetical protein
MNSGMPILSRGFTTKTRPWMKPDHGAHATARGRACLPAVTAPGAGAAGACSLRALRWRGQRGRNRWGAAYPSGMEQWSGAHQWGTSTAGRRRTVVQWSLVGGGENR